MSYQAVILWMALVVVVSGASKIAEWGLPIKSEETTGSSEYARMFLRVVVAAVKKSALIASAVVGFLQVNERSTSETFVTGTRNDIPRILPVRLGKISVMTLSAPVLVGMILTAAERARRKSL